MNDYGSSSEVSPVSRATPPALPPVQAIAPASGARSTLTSDRDSRAGRIATPQVNIATIDTDVASAAEYAKVHVEIADILADLRSANSALTVDDAAGAIQSLMPVPIVLVPLPPATKEAVEHAAVIARRMVEQAAYAKAAQAPLSRGTVDQILASAN